MSPWVKMKCMSRTLSTFLSERTDAERIHIRSWAERGLVRDDPSMPTGSYPPDVIERLRTGLAAESVRPSPMHSRHATARGEQGR